MRILISVEHPAWAHQFRYLIRELEKRGHQVKVVAINKDRDLELLDVFGIKYEVISDSSGRTTFDKGIIFLKTLFRIFRISLGFKPDLYVGRASPMLAINSFLFRKKHIVFDDTERSIFCLTVAQLFSSIIFTPTWFRKNLGKKQVRINAYKELFYLHPNYFTPDPTVLSEMGLSPGDKYVVVRFVAWDAHHDVGEHGLDSKTKKNLIAVLEKYARVFVSSETPLPAEYSRDMLTIAPEKIHDVLYYATLFVSDSSTMTTEAAILGTPAIRCNSFVGPHDMGNFIDLEENYNLIYNISRPGDTIDKAIELLQRPDLDGEWKKKREKLLAATIDITKFMLEFIDNYPQSYEKYMGKKNTGKQ